VSHGIVQAHPWVTRNGSDLLLPEEENIAEIVEAPTEEEMNTAITRNVGHIMAVVCLCALTLLCLPTESADIKAADESRETFQTASRAS
jgi:hypothetical protein